jgi:hypothetical protein
MFVDALKEAFTHVLAEVGEDHPNLGPREKLRLAQELMLGEVEAQLTQLATQHRW